MQAKSFFLGFDISKLTIDYDLINDQDKSLVKDSKFFLSKVGEPCLNESFISTINFFQKHQ